MVGCCGVKEKGAVYGLGDLCCSAASRGLFSAFLPAPRGALLPPGVGVGRGLAACGAIPPPPVSCLQGTAWGMAAKGQL